MMYDMFSETRKVAATIREFFEAYVAMGFTEDQAMDLVKITLSAIVGRPTP